MYAVVATGGKQYRVTEGQVLDVELTGEVGSEIDLPVVMVVDGDIVLATPDQLRGSAVRAKVVGEAKGPKVVGFTYKNKTNQHRRFGHRQRYSTLEISSIRKA
ncbi:MAG TPA: 50S ribosomal protein L21 [Acidimicrobiales bacterium]|nr:50S ribosomal protein L21 [Acidimicrobiales bacterium]